MTYSIRNNSRITNFVNSPRFAINRPLITRYFADFNVGRPFTFNFRRIGTKYGEGYRTYVAIYYYYGDRVDWDRSDTTLTCTATIRIFQLCFRANFNVAITHFRGFSADRWNRLITLGGFICYRSCGGWYTGSGGR